jgi:hypothetical protein
VFRFLLLFPSTQTELLLIGLKNATNKNCIKWAPCNGKDVRDIPLVNCYMRERIVSAFEQLADLPLYRKLWPFQSKYTLSFLYGSCRSEVDVLLGST